MLFLIQENVPEPSWRKESESITEAGILISPSQLVCPHLPPSSNCLLPYTSACPRLQPVMALTLSGSLVLQPQGDSVSLKTKISFLSGRQYLEQLEIRYTDLNQPAGYSWKWAQGEGEEKGQGHLSPPRILEIPALPLTV